MIEITQQKNGDFSVSIQPPLIEPVEFDFGNPPETVGELIDNLDVSENVRITSDTASSAERSVDAREFKQRLRERGIMDWELDLTKVEDE